MSNEEKSSNELNFNVNKFANDGSFMEMFKKMQQQQQQQQQQDKHKHDQVQDKNVQSNLMNQNEPSNKNDSNDSKSSCSTSINSLSKSASSPSVYSSKRRTRPLKVGVIKRQRKDDGDDQDANHGQDAWSRYMNEVRKYKEKYGDDEDKNRPLVK